VKMKKYFHAFICLTLLSISIKAQDSLHICKNQIFIEGLGNDFVDFNSESIGLISINYSRKVIFKNSSFMFSVGIGPVDEGGYTPQRTIVGFPIGILGRGKYKRNGLWFGAFFTPCFGKILYHDVGDHPHFLNYSFQVSPNLTYQFQSKSEHFFVRLSIAPKILASAFTSTDKYGYGDKVILFWGGISIGGAW
jgi:hypothetical protein